MSNFRISQKVLKSSSLKPTRWAPVATASLSHKDGSCQRTPCPCKAEFSHCPRPTSLLWRQVSCGNYMSQRALPSQSKTGSRAQISPRASSPGPADLYLAADGVRSGSFFLARVDCVEGWGGDHVLDGGWKLFRLWSCPFVQNRMLQLQVPVVPASAFAWPVRLKGVKPSGSYWRQV